MPPSAAADRFARIINNLLQAVAEQGGKRIAGPLTMLIWNRLRRMVARFAAIAAAVRAGTYAPSSRSQRIAKSESTDLAPRRPRQHDESNKPRLPTRFAWLLQLAQAPNAACCRSQFIHFLSAPDVLELLAAAPQVGRPMRGLCRMLGIKLDPNLVPPALIPPPRPPRRRHRIKLPSSFPRSFSRHPSREQKSNHAAPCADPADDPESAALVQHILHSAGVEPAPNAARTVPQIRPGGRLPPDPEPAAFAPAAHRLKPA